MTLFGLGSSRLKNLLNDLRVKSVTGGVWHEGSIGGVLKNEKYKGDCHLQKTFTPENKRNQTRQNRGEVQSYYITDNHPAIVSADLWDQVQEERNRRKKERNIGSDGTAKYQNRYPLSGMLVCPYCGKNLRRGRCIKRESSGGVALISKKESKPAGEYGLKIQKYRSRVSQSLR